MLLQGISNRDAGLVSGGAFCMTLCLLPEGGGGAYYTVSLFGSGVKNLTSSKFLLFCGILHVHCFSLFSVRVTQLLLMITIR